MKRSEYRPEWSDSHLLSFVTNSSGRYVAIHADLAGITMLIDELEIIREEIGKNECPHTHLWSHEAAGCELTDTKVAGQSEECNIVCEVKIYGWNEESAVRLGLKSG
jgi:hypothetical protein